MVLSSLKDELKANKPSGVINQQIDDYLAYFFNVMKNIIKTCLLLFFFCTSCIIKEEGGDSTKISIFNYSGRDIEFQQYNKGKYVSSTFILNGDEKEYSFDYKGLVGQYLPPFYVDSIRVFYYEEASIWHTKAANQVVSKSLLLESSYQGGKVKDGLYEFTYTFTEDDFQEAVDFGD